MSHLSTAEITEYLASELSELQRAKVETHLESCEACRKQSLSIKQIRLAFTAMPSPARSAQFTQTVMSQIENLEANKRSPIFNLQLFSFERLFQSCTFALAVSILAFVPERTTQTELDFDQVLVAQFDDDLSAAIFEEDLSQFEVINLETNEG